MEFDSSKVTAVIAVAAIISPILTAIINNVFLLIFKHMENKKAYYKEVTQYKRNVLENYLRSTGCILSQKCNANTALEDYKSSYSLALLYVSSDIRERMKNIDILIKTDRVAAQQELEDLIPDIETLLGKL